METYRKMSKESRRSLIQSEQQKYMALLSKYQSDPLQFVAAVYEILKAMPAQIPVASLHMVIIRNKALFAALSQFDNFPAFIHSIDSPKYRPLFLLSTDAFNPPEGEDYDPLKYWIIPLLSNIHMIAQVGKAIRSLKQPVLQKKFVFTFKPIVSKNLGTAGFSTKIQQLPLGKETSELNYLIRTLVYLLVKEPTLLSASMDIMTIIPHILARIPFGSVIDKLRGKVMQVYEINPAVSTKLVGNTLMLLGAVLPENDPTAKKKAEMSMLNLLFLLKKMYEMQSHVLLEQIRQIIPTLTDENVTLIILRLLKIPPGEHLRNVIITILARCVANSKYSLLIDLMQKHSIVKTLIGYLKFPEVQYNILLLLQFFLVGFQVAPTAFHAAIPDFERILNQLLKPPPTTSTFPKEFTTLLIVLLRLFPGYPIQYTPLVALIKDLVTKFHLEIPSEAKIDETIKTTSWLNITQQLSGATPAAASYSYTASLPQNTSGYKGLYNVGNTCYMNAVLQALFFSLKFRSEVLAVDHDKYVEINQNAKDPAKPVTNSKLVCLFQLQKVFALLLKSSRPYITPGVFRNTLPDYFRKSFMQQDASEFFKVLSDLLEQDAKTICAGESENVFSKHFENKMRVKIQCADCSNVVSKEEQFVDLFIPIDLPDTEPIDASTSDILFKRLLPEEVLEGDNAFYCEKCQKKSTKAVKTCHINHLSNTLILTANRFYYDLALKRRVKKMNPIQFCKSIAVPESALELDENGKYKPEEVLYELYAIVIHSGMSTEAGHYYTIAKDLGCEKWVLLNDIYTNSVTEAEIDTMLTANPSDTPYMLFYQRKSEGKFDPNSLSEKLHKDVEADNISFMKEVENQNKKIDYNKVFNALAAQHQKNPRYFGPEPKRDFDHDGAPDIF